MQHHALLVSDAKVRGRKLAAWIEVVGGIEIALLVFCLLVAVVFPTLAGCAKWMFYLNVASLLAFLGIILVQLFIEWLKEWMTPLP